jgi:hypothetical protein
VTAGVSWATGHYQRLVAQMLLPCKPGNIGPGCCMGQSISRLVEHCGAMNPSSQCSMHRERTFNWWRYLVVHLFRIAAGHSQHRPLSVCLVTAACAQVTGTTRPPADVMALLCVQPPGKIELAPGTTLTQLSGGGQVSGLQVCRGLCATASLFSACIQVAAVVNRCRAQAVIEPGLQGLQGS